MVAAAIVSAPAEARRIFIDFGENSGTGQNFSTSSSACGAGDSAASSCELNLVGDLSEAVALGFHDPDGNLFGINLGGTLYEQVFVSENGILGFGGAVSGIAGDLGDITVPFIAPFHADLVSQDYPVDDDVFNVQDGEILFGRGTADPTEPFVDGEYVPAFHVAWARPTIEGLATQISTQVVLYAFGTNGDFDVDIRHGPDGSTDDYTGLGLAGLSTGVGDGVFNITGPLNGSSYFFSFRGGVCTVGCAGTEPPTPVNEPGTAALFATGLLLLARRRRRNAA